MATLQDGERVLWGAQQTRGTRDHINRGYSVQKNPRLQLQRERLSPSRFYLFEERVSASQECLWNAETYFLCALQVNGQLELRGLLYGQVIWQPTL